MRRLVCLYENLENFKVLLEKENFDYKDKCFVRIFTSVLPEYCAKKLANEIKSVLPNSIILGSSAAACIFEGETISHSTMIVVESYENLDLTLKFIAFEDRSPKDLAENFFNLFNGFKNYPINILMSGNPVIAADFCQEINKFSTRLKLVGGLVSSLAIDDNKNFIFNEKEIFPNHIAAFAYLGQRHSNIIKANMPFDPISDDYVITKVDGNLIEEINFRPAIDVAKEYFQIDIDTIKSNQGEELTYHPNNLLFGIDYYLVNFLMLLENHNGSGRFLYYDKEKEKLGLYFNQIDENQKIKVGFFNPAQSMKTLYNICTEFNTIKPESVFVYSCLFRKVCYNKLANTEIAVTKNKSLCGIFMHGEIAYVNGLNEFLNGSLAFCELSERQSNHKFDLEKIKSAPTIQLDEEVIRLVMEKKHEELSKQEGIFGLKDNDTIGYKNILEYRNDLRQFKYDRTILVYTENANVIISSKGYQKYIESNTSIIKDFRNKIFEKYKSNIHIYELNYSTFVLAFNTNIPTRESKEDLVKFFKENRIVNSSDNISLIFKFILYTNADNQFYTGLANLLERKDENFYLIHNEQDAQIEKTITYEGTLENEVVNVIKYAIENKLIIPYYQGIRNNITGKIEKYEALMRLQDKEGVIYPPNYFMNTALKYNFYIELSFLMINQVLKDFENEDCPVSVNISAHDIYSKNFNDWLWYRIQKYKNSNKLIFEILETEELENWELAKNFIDKARANKIKISIDDFGSGYASMVGLIRVKPDFIKIDGSIVKDIDKLEDNLLVVKAIHFIAKTIGAEVIAEYVENQEIQTLLENEHIEFSQGFYYSVPKPFDKKDK